MLLCLFEPVDPVWVGERERREHRLVSSRDAAGFSAEEPFSGWKQVGQFSLFFVDDDVASYHVREEGLDNESVVVVCEQANLSWAF